ncbi:MAG: GNAT family N-acetyltransferase [Peptococcaceae bacterium]|nr:GNAT family N-acetyltransferase [Peptococcaceae bacterium]
MEFVRAEKKDVHALIESRVVYLRAAIGEMSEAEEAETRQKLLPFFHDHLERDLFVFCARDSKEGIVATAFLMVYEKPFRPDNGSGRYGVVYNVVTKDGFRGRGLATALVKHLLAGAEKMGLERVMLNATEAGRPIYEKLGFQERVSCDMNMVYEL